MAADLNALKTELTQDPVALGYAGKTSIQAAALLNATNTGRSRNRTRVEITEVFNQIDDGAWPSTAILQDKLRGILSMPYVDASNTNTRGIFGAIFPNSGATAATRGRLLALSTEPISRAVELGWGFVTPGEVEQALAQP
jgi:hypothetical protein